MTDPTNWVALNETLSNADEATCVRLLRDELKQANRKIFVFRIHSRLNRVRAAREREELAKVNAAKAVIGSLKWLK